MLLASQKGNVAATFVKNTSKLIAEIFLVVVCPFRHVTGSLVLWFEKVTFHVAPHAFERGTLFMTEMVYFVRLFSVWFQRRDQYALLKNWNRNLVSFISV